MGMGEIEVTSIDPLADPRWDEYVAGRADGRVYHRAAWPAILRSAYGFRPACLATVAPDGRLTGVLPAMLSRGLVTGRRLRSLPTVPVGGPLADGPAEMSSLLRAGCDAAANGARSFMVSSAFDLDGLEPRLVSAPCAPTWVTPLPSDPEELRAEWRRRSKNLHRNLNKAGKAGLTVRESTSDDDLRRFHELYLDTMRRHRALPRSLRFLRASQRALAASGAWRLWVAEADGRIVAGGLFLVHGDTVELLYNASAVDALDLRPNHSIYWHVIEWAIEHGHRRLDWGRAEPDSSLGRFKAQWSAEPEVQYRYHYLVTASAARAVALRDAGKQFDLEEGRDSLPARIWGRAPLPVTSLAAEAVNRFV
jgi:CelD/BcsL family acetyltransferase involved in cellulose biosynthesis